MKIPTPTATGFLLIAALLLPTVSFAQDVRMPAAARVKAATQKRSYNEFLVEVPTGNVEGSYKNEAARVARLLSTGTKGVVLIDEHGYARDLVLGAAVTQLASLKSDKRIYRIDWRSLFETVKNDAELDAVVKDIVSSVESSHGDVVVWLDDLSTFAAATPTLGRAAASKLYVAVAQGRIQVLTASDNASFESQIVADNNLRSRFEKVAFKNEEDADPFVGDKLSADLRDLATGADKNRTVKVILQSDDLNDPQLVATLRKLNVDVDSRAEAFNMMVIYMAASAAQEIASLRAAKHLSLDHKMGSMAGHLETTTGASLVRGMLNQSGVLGAVTTPSTSTGAQLDGSGIGIAIVDSGLMGNHREFIDNSGNCRIVVSADFTGSTSTPVVTMGNGTACGVLNDGYGHGTHVGSLAAGNGGISANPTDAQYMGNYTGIAPNASILNIRVLDATGQSSTATVINALNWLYTNRGTYNVKVVNLSLGTPAVDTWRNDPVDRAVRQLTSAGIVVVAAAGNNGKDANGNKIYGAIHSPGNDPSVITVGAANTFGTDNRDDDAITTFSSRGPTRSFYTDSTGKKVYDNLIKPNLVAPGNKVIGADSNNAQLESSNPQLVNDNGASVNRATMFLSGTSMSTPVVSGTAALLLQANPKLTPNMVKMILEYTAQPLQGANMLEQGAGEVNVEGAVRLARLIRQDMGTSPAKGTAMLTTGTTTPDPTSTIGGTKFQWSQGLIPSYCAVTGTNIITKYQGMYGNGILVSDGILVSNGILVSDGILISDGILVSDGIIISDGVLLTSGQSALATTPGVTKGTKWSPSSTLFGNGGVDRSIFGDGILVSDGILISDGIIVSDTAKSQTNAILASGDDTPSMR